MFTIFLLNLFLVLIIIPLLIILDQFLNFFHYYIVNHIR